MKDLRLPQIPRTFSLADRMAHYTDTSGDCHVWRGSIDYGFGYGVVFFEGGRQYAHRVAWTEKYGAVPPRVCVLHRCDNPPCVNPEHLFLGTRADNHRDKVSKGRQRFKLTLEQVLSIHKDPRPQRKLAALYGVTKTAIQRIKQGKAVMT